MNETQLFNRLRRLSANRQTGDALAAKLDEIESVVKELREVTKVKKTTRQKKGGFDRKEEGGDDR